MSRFQRASSFYDASVTLQCVEECLSNLTSISDENSLNETIQNLETSESWRFMDKLPSSQEILSQYWIYRQPCSAKLRKNCNTLCDVPRCSCETNNCPIE